MDNPNLQCPLCEHSDQYVTLWVHFGRHHVVACESDVNSDIYSRTGIEMGCIHVERLIGTRWGDKSERAVCPICQETLEAREWEGIKRRVGFIFLLHMIEYKETHAVAWMMMLL